MNEIINNNNIPSDIQAMLDQIPDYCGTSAGGVSSLDTAIDSVSARVQVTDIHILFERVEQLAAENKQLRKELEHLKHAVFHEGEI